MRQRYDPSVARWCWPVANAWSPGNGGGRFPAPILDRRSPVHGADIW